MNFFILSKNSLAEPRALAQRFFGGIIAKSLVSDNNSHFAGGGEMDNIQQRLRRTSPQKKKESA
jgi:hypothetical protein